MKHDHAKRKRKKYVPSSPISRKEGRKNVRSEPKPDSKHRNKSKQEPIKQSKSTKHYGWYTKPSYTTTPQTQRVDWEGKIVKALLKLKSLRESKKTLKSVMHH
jgi:hypothetical protein